MTENIEESAATPPNDLDAQYFELVGRVSSDWAGMEYLMNEAIWMVADVSPILGASMTAQIVSATGRLAALLALLKLRGASSRLIRRINKFAEEIRSPTEKRNRIVHDAWGLDASGAAMQLRVTAAKTLVFGLTPVSLETLKADYRSVFACVRRFAEIRNEIAAEQPSWPGIPWTEHRPTVQVHEPPI